MIFRLFNKNHGRVLRDLLSDEEVKGAAPSLVLSAHYKGKKVIHEQFGEDFAFYDWASLTKIVFLAGMWMRTMQSHAVEASDLAREYWPEFKHKRITLAQLFTHTSGLPWWNAYYKKLVKLPRAQRYAALEKALLGEKLKRSKTAVYSDVDMLVLGCLLTHIHEKSWLEMWQEYSAEFPKLQAHYNIVGRPLITKSQYAPTEECSWRRKLLQGEVHDPNTWSLGGVAPHAGLFGRVDDLDIWMLTLRKALRGDENTPFGDPKVVEQFVSRQIGAAQGDFGYIFMKPSKPTSSAGRYFSPESFGHLGFTGTSTWYDPKRDLLVSVLSNRILYGADQQKMRELRPKIHNLVVEVLES